MAATSPSLEIKHLFQKMCIEAQSESKKQANAAVRNRKHKNFHSLTAILINLFTSSVLFGTLTNQVPDFMKWIAASLALLAAICGTLNTFFKYPEREAANEAAQKRYIAFASGCTMSVAKFDDGLIDVSKFQVLLDQHVEEFRILTLDAPSVA